MIEDDFDDYLNLCKDAATYRHYTAPWGVRHAARWVLNALAWLASWGRPPATRRGIVATTPGPFTLWWVTDPDLSVVAHEECHQRQCARHGWARFAWMWCEQVLRHGYADAPFEVEARDAVAAEEAADVWEEKA